MDKATADLVKTAFSGLDSCTVNVHGRSMSPFVRDGDQVTIVPVAGIPAVGSIVALFAGEQLIVHRVISRKVEKSGATIAIAGDSSPGSEAVVTLSELFGIVQKITRGPIEVSGWCRPPLSILAVALGHIFRFLVSGKRFMTRY